MFDAVYDFFQKQPSGRSGKIRMFLYKVLAQNEKVDVLAVSYILKLRFKSFKSF